MHNKTSDFPPIHVVLFEPEIPQNTGNIARTCACTGAELHLVEPMGFHLTQRNIRRSGMDYWDDVVLHRWGSTKEFLDAHQNDHLVFFTGQTDHSLYDKPLTGEVYLIFGRESRGIDQEILDQYADHCVRIPMKTNKRSLNLSNSVAIGVYEVLRANGFYDLRSCYTDQL